MTLGWGFEAWGSVLTSDAVPPAFAGLASATAVGGAVYLSWASATPDVTPPEYVTYKVYRATTVGGESFGSPLATTAHGQLGYLDAAVTPGTTYYYVVRATDLTGNQETNVVERAATVATGVKNQNPPVVGNYVPAVGTPIQTTDAVQFDVTDDESFFRRIVVTVTFASTTGDDGVVHDGVAFKGPYAAQSSRSAIVGGWRYVVRHADGWPGTPTFETFAIDHDGNEAA